ncbi:MAG TPA: hypothetical protein VGG07_19435 [Solirubrobacteraceae bacterium]
MGAPPALLVMESAARPRPELRELLGAERAARLERLLVARATEWADALSAGRTAVAGAEESVADALARVFAESGGDRPLVVVWPVLPCWRAEHAFAVLDDLAAGCEASAAPVFDHGLYLLALARPIPAVLALPDETWDSPSAIGLVLAAINEAEAPVGLVRPERALRRPGDVRAALADPLLDDELRGLLAG